MKHPTRIKIQTRRFSRCFQATWGGGFAISAQATRSWSSIQLRRFARPYRRDSKSITTSCFTQCDVVSGNPRMKICLTIVIYVQKMERETFHVHASLFPRHSVRVQYGAWPMICSWANFRKPHAGSHQSLPLLFFHCKDPLHGAKGKCVVCGVGPAPSCPCTGRGRGRTWRGRSPWCPACSPSRGGRPRPSRREHRDSSAARSGNSGREGKPAVRRSGSTLQRQREQKSQTDKTILMLANLLQKLEISAQQLSRRICSIHSRG